MEGKAPSPGEGEAVVWRRAGLSLAGGVAGVASKTAVAPLDRVKILMQTGATRQVMATFRTIVVTDGWTGLWRGNTVNCFRVFPSKGVLYMANDVYKLALRGYAGVSSTDKLPTYLSVLAGSFSGMTAAAATYPLDLIRARLAGVLLKDHSGGSLSVVRSTFRHEGIRGFYRGLMPTLLGAIPYEGVKFGVYDLMRNSDMMASMSSGNPVVTTLVSGASAGAIAGIALFPNDTVRRIMQMQGSRDFTKTVNSLKKSPRDIQPYKNMFECYRETFRAGGVARFYRGMGPNVLRLVPNTAIQFGVFEYGKALIDDHYQHDGNPTGRSPL